MTPDDIAQINKKLDTVLEILTGNGDPQKGLIVRTDRLEQKSAAASWFIGVVIVALVGLFIGQISLVKVETAHEMLAATLDALPADIAIVTNVDPEHLDHFKTFEAVQEARKQVFHTIRPCHGLVDRRRQTRHPGRGGRHRGPGRHPDRPARSWQLRGVHVPTDGFAKSGLPRITAILPGNKDHPPGVILPCQAE